MRGRNAGTDLLGLLFGAVLLLGLTACESGPTRPTEFQARPVRKGESYLVSAKGDPIGRVIEWVIVDVEHDIRRWQVETLGGQWVGYADQWGNFYRYELFEEREVWLGLYSMNDGLAALFEREGVTWAPETEGTAAPR